MSNYNQSYSDDEIFGAVTEAIVQDQRWLSYFASGLQAFGEAWLNEAIIEATTQVLGAMFPAIHAYRATQWVAKAAKWLWGRIRGNNR